MDTQITIASGARDLKVERREQSYAAVFMSIRCTVVLHHNAVLQAILLVLHT